MNSMKFARWVLLLLLVVYCLMTTGVVRAYVPCGGDYDCGADESCVNARCKPSSSPGSPQPPSCETGDACHDCIVCRGNTAQECRDSCNISPEGPPEPATSRPQTVEEMNRVKTATDLAMPIAAVQLVAKIFEAPLANFTRVFQEVGDNIRDTFFPPSTEPAAPPVEPQNSEVVSANCDSDAMGKKQCFGGVVCVNGTPECVEVPNTNVVKKLSENPPKTKDEYVQTFTSLECGGTGGSEEAHFGGIFCFQTRPALVAGEFDEQLKLVAKATGGDPQKIQELTNDIYHGKKIDEFGNLVYTETVVRASCRENQSVISLPDGQNYVCSSGRVIPKETPVIIPQAGNIPGGSQVSGGRQNPFSKEEELIINDQLAKICYAEVDAPQGGYQRCIDNNRSEVSDEFGKFFFSTRLISDYCDDQSLPCASAVYKKILNGSTLVQDQSGKVILLPPGTASLDERTLVNNIISDFGPQKGILADALANASTLKGSGVSVYVDPLTGVTTMVQVTFRPERPDVKHYAIIQMDENETNARLISRGDLNSLTAKSAIYDAAIAKKAEIGKYGYDTSVLTLAKDPDLMGLLDAPTTAYVPFEELPQNKKAEFIRIGEVACRNFDPTNQGGLKLCIDNYAEQTYKSTVPKAISKPVGSEGFFAVSDPSQMVPYANLSKDKQAVFVKAGEVYCSNLGPVKVDELKKCINDYAEQNYKTTTYNVYNDPSGPKYGTTTGNFDLVKKSYEEVVALGCSPVAGESLQNWTPDCQKAFQASIGGNFLAQKEQGKYIWANLQNAVVNFGANALVGGACALGLFTGPGAPLACGAAMVGVNALLVPYDASVGAIEAQDKENIARQVLEHSYGVGVMNIGVNTNFSAYDLLTNPEIKKAVPGLILTTWDKQRTDAYYIAYVKAAMNYVVNYHYLDNPDLVQLNNEIARRDLIPLINKELPVGVIPITNWDQVEAIQQIGVDLADYKKYVSDKSLAKIFISRKAETSSAYLIGAGASAVLGVGGEITGSFVAPAVKSVATKYAANQTAKMLEKEMLASGFKGLSQETVRALSETMAETALRETPGIWKYIRPGDLAKSIDLGRTFAKVEGDKLPEEIFLAGKAGTRSIPIGSIVVPVNEAAEAATDLIRLSIAKNAWVPPNDVKQVVNEALAKGEAAGVYFKDGFNDQPFLVTEPVQIAQLLAKQNDGVVVVGLHRPEVIAPVKRAVNLAANGLGANATTDDLVRAINIPDLNRAILNGTDVALAVKPRPPVVATIPPNVFQQIWIDLKTGWNNLINPPPGGGLFPQLAAIPAGGKGAIPPQAVVPGAETMVRVAGRGGGVVQPPTTVARPVAIGYNPDPMVEQLSDVLKVEEVANAKRLVGAGLTPNQARLVLDAHANAQIDTLRRLGGLTPEQLQLANTAHTIRMNTLFPDTQVVEANQIGRIGSKIENLPSGMTVTPEGLLKITKADLESLRQIPPEAANKLSPQQKVAWVEAKVLANQRADVVAMMRLEPEVWTVPEIVAWGLGDEAETLAAKASAYVDDVNLNPALGYALNSGEKQGLSSGFAEGLATNALQRRGLLGAFKPQEGEEYLRRLGFDPSLVTKLSDQNKQTLKGVLTAERKFSSLSETDRQVVSWATPGEIFQTSTPEFVFWTEIRRGASELPTQLDTGLARAMRYGPDQLPKELIEQVRDAKQAVNQRMSNNELADMLTETRKTGMVPLSVVGDRIVLTERLLFENPLLGQRLVWVAPEGDSGGLRFLSKGKGVVVYEAPSSVVASRLLKESHPVEWQGAVIERLAGANPVESLEAYFGTKIRVLRPGEKILPSDILKVPPPEIARIEKTPTQRFVEWANNTAVLPGGGSFASWLASRGEIAKSRIMWLSSAPLGIGQIVGGGSIVNTAILVGNITQLVPTGTLAQNISESLLGLVMPQELAGPASRIIGLAMLYPPVTRKAVVNIPRLKEVPKLLGDISRNGALAFAKFLEPAAARSALAGDLAKKLAQIGESAANTLVPKFELDQAVRLFGNEPEIVAYLARNRLKPTPELVRQTNRDAAKTIYDQWGEQMSVALPSDVVLRILKKSPQKSGDLDSKVGVSIADKLSVMANSGLGLKTQEKVNWALDLRFFGGKVDKIPIPWLDSLYLKSEAIPIFAANEQQVIDFQIKLAEYLDIMMLATPAKKEEYERFKVEAVLNITGALDVQSRKRMAQYLEGGGDGLLSFADYVDKQRQKQIAAYLVDRQRGGPFFEYLDITHSGLTREGPKFITGGPIPKASELIEVMKEAIEFINALKKPPDERDIGIVNISQPKGTQK